MTYTEIILIGIVINLLMFILLSIISVILAIIENYNLDSVKKVSNQMMLLKKMSEWRYARDNVKSIRKYKESVMIICIPFANVLYIAIVIYKMINQGYSNYMYNRLDREIQEFKEMDKK